jgi:hypothetical protein
MQSRLSIVALLVWFGTCAMPYATAADSVQNAIGASKHAIQAVTTGIVASGQATLGVLAVPMLSVGAVGSAIGTASTAAEQRSTAATGLPVNGQLPVTDKTITVTSPAEALKSRATTPR